MKWEIWIQTVYTLSLPVFACVIAVFRVLCNIKVDDGLIKHRLMCLFAKLCQIFKFKQSNSRAIKSLGLFLIRSSIKLIICNDNCEKSLWSTITIRNYRSINARVYFRYECLQYLHNILCYLCSTDTDRPATFLCCRGASAVWHIYGPTITFISEEWERERSNKTVLLYSRTESMVATATAAQCIGMSCEEEQIFTWGPRKNFFMGQSCFELHFYWNICTNSILFVVLTNYDPHLKAQEISKPLLYQLLSRL